MATLAHVDLPAEWIDLCEALSVDLIESSAFQQALGQLYDGQETMDTLLEIGEISRLVEESVPLKVSDAALQDVGEWLHSLGQGCFRLPDFYVTELEHLFRSTEGVEERTLGAVLCLFRPMTQWYSVQYYQRVLAMGRSLPSTCQRYHSDPETAVRNWCEERIWGGLLDLAEGELTVTRLHRPPWVFSKDRLLNLRHGMESLPLQPAGFQVVGPTFRRCVGRMEDDPWLMDLMRNHKYEGTTHSAQELREIVPRLATTEMHNTDVQDTRASSTVPLERTQRPELEPGQHRRAEEKGPESSQTDP